jgi:hypothetical protein
VTIATNVGRETIATNVGLGTTATARRASAASRGVWLAQVGGHRTSAEAAAVTLAAGMASAANAKGAPKVVAGTAVSPTRSGSEARLSRLQMTPRLVMKRMTQRPPRRRRRSQVCRSRTKGREEQQSRLAAVKMRKTGRRRGGADRAARRRRPRLRLARRPLTHHLLRPLPARRVERNERQGDDKNYSGLILIEFTHTLIGDTAHRRASPTHTVHTWCYCTSKVHVDTLSRSASASRCPHLSSLAAH